MKNWQFFIVLNFGHINSANNSRDHPSWYFHTLNAQISKINFYQKSLRGRDSEKVRPWAWSLSTGYTKPSIKVSLVPVFQAAIVANISRETMSKKFIWNCWIIEMSPSFHHFSVRSLLRVPSSQWCTTLHFIGTAVEHLPGNPSQLQLGTRGQRGLMQEVALPQGGQDGTLTSLTMDLAALLLAVTATERIKKRIRMRASMMPVLWLPSDFWPWFAVTWHLR